MRKAKDHLKEEWSDVFQIDEKSPSGLSWRIGGNNKSVGSPVGWLTELNYWKCEYKNKTIAVHRILFFLYNGYLDEEMVVDHFDGNPQNNKKENLRQISYADNCRNRKLGSNNLTGINGIHENHDFVVTWSENGKPRSKKFSVIKLGYDNALTAAQEFRNQQIERLTKNGADYTEQHGKERL